jgi:hypothetical protein
MSQILPPSKTCLHRILAQFLLFSYFFLLLCKFGTSAYYISLELVLQKNIVFIANLVFYLFGPGNHECERIISQI